MFADLSGFESVMNWRDGLDPVVARKYCWRLARANAYTKLSEELLKQKL